jgi:TPP-dependent pyruvate/acetoin dehydrogenase alpha subunit
LLRSREVFLWRVVLSETVPRENPLVNNKKLREMFVAMVEARCLDEHVAVLQRKRKIHLRLDSIRGQEACRVSTAIDLVPGDLVSDSQVCVGMDLILGMDAGSLLKCLTARASGDKASGSVSGKQLPRIEGVADRLRIAMGAALAFKALERANIVVAYVLGREATGSVWRRTLTLAAKLDLPMIFVVLPEGDSKSKNASRKTRAFGVPGIPVDASDAVALYRVTQESIGRTRGGDGPVVIECVRYRLKGKQGASALDPIAQMKELLLARKVDDQTWMDRVEEAFRQRLATQKL